jgi:hypothetical protein
MGRFVIAVCRRRPGMKQQLLAEVARHRPVPRAEALAA